MNEWMKAVMWLCGVWVGLSLAGLGMLLYWIRKAGYAPEGE